MQENIFADVMAPLTEMLITVYETSTEEQKKVLQGAEGSKSAMQFYALLLDTGIAFGILLANDPAGGAASGNTAENARKLYADNVARLRQLMKSAKEANN